MAKGGAAGYLMATVQLAQGGRTQLIFLYSHLVFLSVVEAPSAKKGSNASKPAICYFRAGLALTGNHNVVLFAQVSEDCRGAA